MKKIRAKYYIAYGSNLNLEQIARRCPTAKVVGSTTLKNYRLMFRGRQPYGSRHCGTQPGGRSAGAHLALTAQG